MSDQPAPPLARAFDSPETKRRHVRRLFETIAARYDLITRLLSFGLDQRWKRRVSALAAGRPDTRTLDLACGTGDLALMIRKSGGPVAGLDLARPMLDLARQKPGGREIAWLVGDMGDLPFPSGSFDIVTTGYGLRNVPDLPRALAEIFRVLRPEGRMVSLDFNRPSNPVVRAVYLAYLSLVGASLGWLLHRDPDTYRYIPASIRRYPGAKGVVVMLQRAGFREVRHEPLLGGFMAIHFARK